MNVKQAVVTYSQGEKIKSGLIWANQLLDISRGLPDCDKKGAEAMIQTAINMIAHEVHLADNLLKNEKWSEALKNIDTALVMINSGVAQESSHHLTRALSCITSICHRAMSVLKENELF